MQQDLLYVYINFRDHLKIEHTHNLCMYSMTVTYAYCVHTVAEHKMCEVTVVYMYTYTRHVRGSGKKILKWHNATSTHTHNTHECKNIFFSKIP